MSPTTLYREGTDLDELLADLDEQYPGQVQVLEITHPREGGVLGFFAKQRVGVHYRLADETADADPFMTALTAARGRAETMAEAVPVGAGAFRAASGSSAAGSSAASMTGRGAVGGHGAAGGTAPGRGSVLDVFDDEVPAGVAAAAAAIAASMTDLDREEVAATRSTSPAPRAARPAGLGPDPETLAAALAGRAAAPTAGTVNPTAASADPFANLLASIAVKRPTANLGARLSAQAALGRTAAPTPQAPAHTAAPDAGRDPGDGLARALASAYAGGAEQRPVEVDSPPRASAQPASGAGAAAAGYAAADLAATDFAAAGFDIVSAPEPAATDPDSVAGGTAVPGVAAPAQPAITLKRTRPRAAVAAAATQAAVVTAQPVVTPQPAAGAADVLLDAAATAGSMTAIEPRTDAIATIADPANATPWQPAERISTRDESGQTDSGAPAPSGSRIPAPAVWETPWEAPTPGDETVPASTRPVDPADALPDPATAAASAPTRRRSASLSWPIAQSVGAPADTSTGRRIPAPGGSSAAPAAGHGISGTRAAERQASGTQAADHPAAHGRTMVLPRQAEAPADPAAPSSAAGTQRATSLALRRQLLEIGVPVDRVPGDAVHTYAAIEQLVHALPGAPAAPSRPDGVLVVVGSARDVVSAADGLLAGAPAAFESIWTFGCPAASGTRRIPTTGANVLADADRAGAVAAEARAALEGPLLIVIATDTAAGRDHAADVIAAVAPDAVWAAVDATRKPADTRRALAPAGHLDGMIVTHAEHSSSPATVWELDLPIALVDGRASTGPVWAVLLLDKLGQLAREEEAACSGARC